MTMSTYAGGELLREGVDLLRDAASRYPDIDDLVDIAGYRGGRRVSLYLPLDRDGSTYEKTRIRAKNLLRQVARALRADGMPRPEVSHLLASAEAVVAGLRRRSVGAAGLAMFIGRERVRYFLTPMRVPEVAAVGERFTIAPLLPAFAADARFFVLAVSQDEITLFAGTRHTLREVDLDGHELAAWKSLPPVRKEAQVEAFLADRGGRGRRTVHHGVDGAEERKAALARHFRGVDRALRAVLEGDEAPLVLAGVRRIQALYAQVSTYPHLLEAGIDGNSRDLRAEKLHERAWSLVAPELHRSTDEAVARYHDLRGTGRTVHGAADVLAAAERGQVETLLLTQRTAREDAAPSSAPSLRELADVTHPDDRLERAALATVSGSGRVFLVPDEDLGADVAGILRYWTTPA